MKSRSHKLRVADPFKREADGSLTIVDLEEVEIGLYSKNHEQFGGQPLKELCYDPRKRLVIRAESKNECGDSVVVYRRFRGAPVEKDIVRFGSATYAALKSVQNSSDREFYVCVRAMPALTGRWLLYWYHPDDAARVSFKLGMIGIVLGLLSLMFDWKDIRDFFSCLIGT